MEDYANFVEASGMMLPVVLEEVIGLWWGMISSMLSNMKADEYNRMSYGGQEALLLQQRV